MKKEPPVTNYGLAIELWSYDYQGTIFVTGKLESAFTSAAVIEEWKNAIESLHTGTNPLIEILTEVTGTTSKSEYTSIPDENRVRVFLDMYYGGGEVVLGSGDTIEINKHDSFEDICSAVRGADPHENSFKHSSPGDDQQHLTEF